jgi:hypothetical protein
VPNPQESVHLTANGDVRQPSRAVRHDGRRSSIVIEEFVASLAFQRRHLNPYSSTLFSGCHSSIG